MKITPQRYEIFEYDITEDNISNLYKKMEMAARTCYKTEDNKCLTLDESAKWLSDKIIKTGHHSVLEHASVTVKIWADRAILNELTRHRIGVAFSQESTRYCNYSKNKFGNEISVIHPEFFEKDKIRKPIQNPFMENDNIHMNEYDVWKFVTEVCEWGYNTLNTDFKCPSEQSRTVLPLSLESSITMTSNFREWRKIFEVRAKGLTGKPHPQIQKLFSDILIDFQDYFPGIFDDI